MLSDGGVRSHTHTHTLFQVQFRDFYLADQVVVLQILCVVVGDKQRMCGSLVGVAFDLTC
jgi:hypothetical protein